MTRYYSSFVRGKPKSDALKRAKEKVWEREPEQPQPSKNEMAISPAPPLHVALLDSSGSILSVNDPWLQSDTANLLRGPGFGVGRNYVELCESVTGELSELARAAAAGIRRLLQGDAADFNVEYSWPSPTGEIWFRLVGTRLGAERDSGVVVVHADISGRKMTEDAVRQREEYFNDLFSEAAICIATCTPQGRFLHANKAYCRMLGYTEEELRTRDFASLTHPDDLPLNLKLRDELLAGERKSFVMVEHHLNKNGDLVWTRQSVSAGHAVGGEIATLIVVAEDITEWKKAEKSLLLFRTLIDKSNDAIEVLDAETLHFIDVSESACVSLGYSREELLGLSMFDVDPDIHHGLRKKVVKALETSGFITFQSRHRRKDGSTFPVEIHLKRVQLDRSYDIGVVRDITERKILEQQLLRSQRMESIGALTGGIAHDLNNILAPIMMSIRVLKEISYNPQAKDILRTIEASANRGANIVRQILSFARGLEGQKTEIRPKVVVQEISNIIKDTFPKDIQIHFSVPNQAWKILGDPTQVHQIVLNLCLNARDAMPKGGVLTIAFENCVLDNHAAAMERQARSGRFVRINITDTGTGMKPEVLRKIFEPFYTTKAVGQGTGLGLSTVVALVKSLDGHVNVYSELGLGTTFKVYLPALEAPVRARKRPAEKAGLPRGNGQTILVVDDEAPIRKITQKTLSIFGYRVLTAANGKKAMSLYAKHRKKIEVVITDMGMPVMDGAAVIRALAESAPNLKIIAASGLRSKSGLTKELRAKVQYVLTKPYTAETLLKTLRAALDGD